MNVKMRKYAGHPDGDGLFGGNVAEILDHVRKRRPKKNHDGDDALVALLEALDQLEHDRRLGPAAADGLREQLLDAVESHECGLGSGEAVDAVTVPIRGHALHAGIVSPWSHPILRGRPPMPADNLDAVRGEVEVLARKVNDLERHGKVRGDRARGMKARLSLAATAGDAVGDGRRLVDGVREQVRVLETYAPEGMYDATASSESNPWADWRTGRRYAAWGVIDADKARAAADKVISSKGNAWSPTPRTAPATGVQENAVVQMSFAAAKAEESTPEPGSRSASEIASEMISSTYLSANL
jgi:hypothetical protein